MPGTKITDQDRSIHSKFICTSCNLLLSAPMQTSCGHLMCASCVDALLESSNPRCPFNDSELKKEEIFPDVFIKREIQALSLHCANSGCRWYGTYVELEAHSKVCEQALINCVHAQCKMNFQRSHLGEHLKNECAYRSVKCNHCHKNIPFASLKGHVRTGCEATPVTCKFCKQKILRRDIEKHEQVCEEIPGESEFQAVGCNHERTSRRKEPRQHANNGLIANIRLLFQFCFNLVSDLASYVIPQGLTPAIQNICDEVHNIHTRLRTILRKAGQRTPHVDRMAGTQREPHQHVNNWLIANVRHWLQSSLDLGPKLARYAIGLEYKFQVQEIYERIDEVHSALKAIFTKITQRIPLVIPMHLNDSLIEHGHLLLSFIQNMVSELDDDITDVRSGLAEKLTGLERRIEGLESGGGHGRGSDEIRELRASIQSMTTEISSLREKVSGLEQELREKDAQIDRMQSRMDQIDESLALNTLKITDLESQRGPRAQQPIHSYNGTLLWKIDAYQRKRQDAINGVKTALNSPPFYSAQYGYKMSAKIYMNGDGFGKGSHLSLFFVVMRGDYDSLQTWPFQKKITMMLLDQGNGDHMVDAFNSDPQSSCFRRPKSDMNIASGSSLFMPIESSSNRLYSEDDVLFTKINIVD